MELREAGVRTFEEAEEFEAERRKQQGAQGKGLDWAPRSVSHLGLEEPSTIAQVLP